MPKFKITPRMIVEIDYRDGSKSWFESDSDTCKSYFSLVVGTYLENRSNHLREIRLYDNRHVLIRTFTQNI